MLLEPLDVVLEGGGRDNPVPLAQPAVRLLFRMAAS
jgi:hypothetical protein